MRPLPRRGTCKKFLHVTEPRSGLPSLTKGRDTDVTVFVNHQQEPGKWLAEISIGT